MPVEFETRKETNTLVKWKVCLPRINRSVKSESFQVGGFYWDLNLASNPYVNGSDEVWSMELYYYGAKPRPCFPLKVYIRDKGKDIYLSQEEISYERTIIWRTLHSDFHKKYPTVHVDGTNLQFVLDFNLGIPDPETPIKVEKSVQTNDSNTDTKYPDNHHCLENLSLDLSKLVEGGTDTDVQLKCGDVSIGAHKMILGARSEVFRTMMQSDMVEGRQGIVEIIDMEPKILKIFIRYIYTGILPELTVDTALPIYEAADKYQVEALKKRSSHLLVKNLSPENALAILVAADAHSDSDLKDHLVPYISEKQIPTRKVEWLKFCNEYPKLANEVLNFMMYQVFPVNS